MARHPLDLKDAKSPKAKINRENLRQALVLFTYLKPHRGKFIMGLVFIALSAFTTSLFPLFLGKMIDAASPGVALPGSDTASRLGFGFKDIHWSLNTTLLLIFAQLTIQTISFRLCAFISSLQSGNDHWLICAKMCTASCSQCL